MDSYLKSNNKASSNYQDPNASRSQPQLNPHPPNTPPRSQRPLSAGVCTSVFLYHNKHTIVTKKRPPPYSFRLEEPLDGNNDEGEMGGYQSSEMKPLSGESRRPVTASTRNRSAEYQGQNSMMQQQQQRNDDDMFPDAPPTNDSFMSSNQYDESDRSHASFNYVSNIII